MFEDFEDDYYDIEEHRSAKRGGKRRPRLSGERTQPIPPEFRRPPIPIEPSDWEIPAAGDLYKNYPGPVPRIPNPDDPPRENEESD